MSKRKPRLLIFVIAYYAESTLRSVLERIPGSIFDEYEAEILVVDDASTDRTFDIGRDYQDNHPDIRMNVLRNELNQGYGGNQKVGYAFAIEQSFDFVAMVHGDGQYAPEELPRLVAPLREGRAEAVFGSRMMSRFGALNGGMPLYKFVGNKILTGLQNGMLGTKFSEFHSGYRIYSTAALRRIPFELNSNDFHFDTEIILQLLNAKQRILELPIPTYYGDEISRVDGIKYAKDVLLATLRNRMHLSGLLYQRKFDPIEPEASHAPYPLKLGYPSSHTYAIAAVPPGSRVVDIGADPGGAVARELVAKHCHVAVVDRQALALSVPEVREIQQDLDAPLSFDPDEHDYLLMLDIVEHLRDPELFLDQVRAKFGWTPRTLVLTTPNVAFVVQRVMLLFGQFNYGRVGILDRTHTRLFTFRSLQRLLVDAGFKIKEVRGIPAPFPKALGTGFMGKAAIRLNLALIRISRTMFSYQIFVTAESTPHVSFVLRDARENSARARERARHAQPGARIESENGVNATRDRA
ncbi:MAG TPA: glycosyltransferase [Polyangiaceae bacterium]|nr:glycosyltransferase [Polyangiaceae bacterium]